MTMIPEIASHRLLARLGLLVLLAAPPSFAQQPADGAAAQSAAAKKAPVKAVPSKKSGIDRVAQKKVCRKYAGKLIGYYGKVYRVKNCQRVPVEKDTISGSIRRFGAVKSVEGDIIKLIPLAKQRVKKRLTCREAEGRVFLTLSGQIFQVAGCRRYTFPDWETFLEYRRKGRVVKRSFVEVEDRLARTLPEARVYPSVLDADSAAFLRDNENYDIIPAKRACKGLEGRFVTYYSQIYKIERCKRRPVSISSVKLARLKLKELSSSEWLSIPEGKPLKL